MHGQIGYNKEPAVRSMITQHVEDLLPRIEYRVVKSDFDLDAIFRLRYRCYLKEGAISKNANERLTDQFDTRIGTNNFALYIDGVIVSAIRINVITRDDDSSPSLLSFRDELSQRIEPGDVVIDPTRFVVDPDYAKMFPKLFYATLRMAFASAEYYKADKICVSVRKEHMPFYSRMLRCRNICEPRPYLQLLKPLGLMMVNYQEEKDKVFDRLPFFRVTKLEARGFFENENMIS